MSEPRRAERRYKTSSWKAYNAALKSRGSLAMWLDRDIQWYAPASGKRCRQQTFLEIRAIEVTDNNSVGDAPMLPELLMSPSPALAAMAPTTPMRAIQRSVHAVPRL